MSRFPEANESDPLLGGSNRAVLYTEKPLKPLERQGPHCCTICCSFLATSCCIFLFWIGIYASVGWNYQPNGWSSSQIGQVQRNAFAAAAMWGATAALSIWSWKKSKLRPTIDVVREREHGE